jgi:hypothetical protein
LVEHWLPKPGVVGSSPIVRSRHRAGPGLVCLRLVPLECPRSPRATRRAKALPSRLLRRRGDRDSPARLLSELDANPARIDCECLGDVVADPHGERLAEDLLPANSSLRPARSIGLSASLIPEAALAHWTPGAVRRPRPASYTDQRTTTVSSIQGWIAQMNRCVPGVSAPAEIVVSSPAPTKLSGPMKNVGGSVVPNMI